MLDSLMLAKKSASIKMLAFLACEVVDSWLRKASERQLAGLECDKVKKRGRLQF